MGFKVREIAGSNTVSLTCRRLQRYSRDVLAHPAYSPDFALRDFQIFGPLAKDPAGKWFAAEADVKQVVASWLHTINFDFFYDAGLQVLVSR